MKADHLFININSADPQRLIAFFADVIGLPRNDVVEGAFDAGGAVIGIDAHSDITTDTHEPARVLLNFGVADLDAEEERLEGLGVRFIRKQAREPWGGVISTFVDPDGNYYQLVEYRP